MKAPVLVDEHESEEGMAVHAHLHRQEAEDSNAGYRYRIAGHQYRRPDLLEEWLALVEGLLS